jgi:exonuclease VII small subunit
MYRLITRRVSLLVLLASIGLAGPTPANAQSVQKNESDIEFAKRLTTRLKRVEKQAEQFEDTIKKMSRQLSQNEMTQQGQLGRQDRMSAGDPEADYRRASIRMRSTRRSAEKERESLAELQRTGSSISPSDRDRIEATVSKLERGIADMERAIRQRRF